MESIAKRIDRNRVKGFLRTEGRKIVNGNGEEILLTGWGLGNWLNPEGYMWLSDSPNFTRGRDIEKAILELTGADYAARFWKTFRARFIAESDIKKMAEEGYNSVRVPINWRLFMEETEGEPVWKEEGFALLDKLLDWCEDARIYAIIDLHAAPGGQTGSNIDDSARNLPELFMNPDYFAKGIALWRKLAERYRAAWIVGAYDLLNEPIMPNDGNTFDQYVPELKRFYHEAIRAIREAGDHHMVTLEGHHWSTDAGIFDEEYDGNAVIHFHRYACKPEEESIKEFLEVSKRTGMPLWLGETGENKIGWYAAYYPMMLSYGIGYNIWPWKKMETDNSPCSVKKPEGWEKLIDFTKGKARPEAEEAERILNEFLENILFENCIYRPEVVSYAFRRQPCTLRAQDYDLRDISGKAAYTGLSDNSGCGCRPDQGLCLREKYPEPENAFFFDTRWDRYSLRLAAGEHTCYTFWEVAAGAALRITGVENAACLKVFQDGKALAAEVSADGCSIDCILEAAEETVIRIEASGEAELERISVK